VEKADHCGREATRSFQKSMIWEEFGGSRASDAAIAKLGQKNDKQKISAKCGLTAACLENCCLPSTSFGRPSASIQEILK
jgi:hypothetical protein